MCQNYKRFEYVDFIKIKDKTILYNYVNKAMIALNDNSILRKVKAILRMPNRVYKKNDFFNLREQLIINGFLVPINLKSAILLKQMKKPKNIELAIHVSDVCNFSCAYCYQTEKKHSIMLECTADKLFNKVKAEITRLNVKELNVAWLGGEPLLNLSIIENLSMRFRQFCIENNIKYTSGIITNGYLLTKTVAENLKKAGVISVQLSIDGDKKAHDSLRRLHGENPPSSYQRILNNLITAVNVFGPYAVVLRIHVNKTNCANIISFLYEIYELQLLNKIIINLVRIKNTNKKNSKTLSYRQFGIFYSKINSLLQNKQMEYYLDGILPPLYQCRCSAENDYSIAVSADGSLYKCWEDVGTNIVANGSLDDSSELLSSLSLPYADIFKKKDKQCSNCRFFPVCSTGCPKELVAKSADFCRGQKLIIHSQVRYLYTHKIRKNK